MDRLPPRWVRRIVVTPLALALCLALAALSPVFLLISFVIDLIVRGPWRTVRLVSFLLGYVALEVAGLVAMFALWIEGGFGLWLRSPRMQRIHYGYMRWWLSSINRLAKTCFHLQVFIEEPPTPRTGPILVFSRHAGPGNSLLLIGTLAVGFKRYPRIVMLNKLQWEPLYDVMLNRLPNRFIKHDPKRRDLYTQAIGDLAASMGDNDAFVLFPEGKDFTPKVKMRAVEYLRSKGLKRAAARAERMQHVLPPRHGGVMAAMAAAPNAEVVLVAHSVLEDIGSFKELWGHIPFDQPVKGRYWRVHPREVPKGTDNLIAWLYDWWEDIDDWIAEHKPGGTKRRKRRRKPKVSR